MSTLKPVIVDTEYRRETGGTPHVHCLVAKELFTGRLHRLRRDELLSADAPPFPVGEDSIVVGYYLPAEFSCFLELGWNRPVHSLDLYTENRWLRGRREGSESLVGALTDFGLIDKIPPQKNEWRKLAVSCETLPPGQYNGLLDYCEQDVLATEALYQAMVPHIDRERGLLRGRYQWSIAEMERLGIPTDADLLLQLRDRCEEIKDRLIAELDWFGVYDGQQFRQSKFVELIECHRLPWPVTKTGRPDLKDSTFRDMAKVYPREIGRYSELRRTINWLRAENLEIGPDGRNRTALRPFASMTGRNQPGSTKFVFGLPRWLRALVKPGPGRFVAYLDWQQQEVAIAAALSKDANLCRAYESGDVYLAFAEMAGELVSSGNGDSHREIRDRFKLCMLATLYGMQPRSLALRLGSSEDEAASLLLAHRRAFPRYWEWTDHVETNGYGTGEIRTMLGWRRSVAAEDPPTSVRNFPVQATGAEMLRLAIMRMQDQGVSVIAPVHDAVLVEGSIADEARIIKIAVDSMVWAGKQLLDGFELRVDRSVVRFPDRLLDSSDVDKWNTLTGLIELTEGNAPVDRMPAAPSLLQV